MERKTISLKGVDQLQLLGSQDEHLKVIQSAFQSTVVIRGDEAILSGEDEEVRTIERLFMELIFLVTRNGSLKRQELETVIDMVKAGNGTVSKDAGTASPVIFYGKKGLIRPRSQGQEQYCASVAKNDLVFVIGPAGTGKTYLAVGMALAALRNKEVSRIVLTRPAIEAGENLGYLPGDMMEKVDPYLRPLTDALWSMLPADQLQKYVEQKTIEVVPLAYMRGRTLNDAFIILDEAQNTSPMQMKMFLTRLGINSKAIINGDITQIDLDTRIQSGLVQIQDILKGIEGIAFITLDKKDVVRHRLVKEIIQAYEDFIENGEEEKPS